MENEIENILLIVNIGIWTLILFYFWKQEKKFSANILILCSYLGYSVVSWLYYNESYPQYQGVTLFPFLFLQLMILIALRPVSDYCKSEVQQIEKPNDRAIISFLSVFVICSIYTLVVCLPKLQTGLVLLLLDVDAGQDLYDETMADASELGNGTSFMNLPLVFSNVFGDVGIFTTCYYFVREKINKWYALILLISLLSPIFQAVAMSQRGPAIDRVYTIAVTFLLYNSFYSSRIKRIAKIGALVLVAILFVFMASITISRFGLQSEEKMNESLYSYVGMENLEFNLYAFDNNGLRYGDRTAPIFKRMLGFENVPHNFVERRKKYPHLKTDDYAFIGFVGDFCLDYGPIISFLLFVFFSSLFCIKTRFRNGKIELHKLLLIQFAACVCMCGGMKLFSFADTGNLKILAVLLSYFYFKYTSIPVKSTKKLTVVHSNG